MQGRSEIMCECVCVCACACLQAQGSVKTNWCVYGLRCREYKQEAAVKLVGESHEETTLWIDF